MTACRFHRGGRCIVDRFGERPSPGVCRACIAAGGNRIKGAGDVVRVLLEPLHRAGIVGAAQRAVGGPCGCRERRDAMNRLIPRPRPRSRHGASTPRDGEGSIAP